jgi:hypothetical protein
MWLFHIVSYGFHFVSLLGQVYASEILGIVLQNSERAREELLS